MAIILLYNLVCFIDWLDWLTIERNVKSAVDIQLGVPVCAKSTIPEASQYIGDINKIPTQTSNSNGLNNAHGSSLILKPSMKTSSSTYTVWEKSAESSRSGFKAKGPFRVMNDLGQIFYYVISSYYSNKYFVLLILAPTGWLRDWSFTTTNNNLQTIFRK